MALPTGGYSYTPQTANLGASPLSALKPLDVGVSVSFTPMPKYEVPSAQEELVSMGAAKGFQSLAEPVFAAIKAKDDERVRKEDAALKYRRDLEIAKIRGEKTERELKMEELRYKDLENRVNERGGNKGDVTINSGSFEDETPIGDSDLPTNQEADVQNDPSLFNITEVENPNFLGQINPTQEKVAALWNTPLAQLTASAGTAGSQQEQALASMGAGTLTPSGQAMSTDTPPQPQAPTPAPEEPRFGLMSKFRGLYTPEEAKKMRAEFSGKMEEFSGDGKMEPVPSGLGYQFDKPMRDVAPVRVEKAIPVGQASQATAKPTRKDLSRYIQNWSDPSVAASAVDKIAEIMGSEYAYPELREIKDKNQNVIGYRPEIPKRLSGKELADLKKSTTPELKDLTNEERKPLINLKSSAQDLAGIAKRLKSIPAMYRGPVAGWVAGKNPYEKDIQTLISQTIQIIPGLARGVFQEVGVLNEKDIERYTKTIPDILKDPKVAEEILDELNGKLDRAIKNTIDAYERSGLNVKGFKEGYFDQEKPSVDQEKQSKDSVRSEMINISKQLRDPKLDPKKKQELEKKYNDLKNSFLTK